MSSDDQHSNPPPDKLSATLSAAQSSSNPKMTEKARAEVTSHMSDPAANEVTEAAEKFVTGVDVITETLILILGKFKLIIWRTNIGMAFGAAVFLVCAYLTIKVDATSRLQEANEKKFAELTAQFEETLKRLDKLQVSAEKTEKKVEEVQKSAEEKPSIEIIPNINKPGEAKVVIRPGPKTPEASGARPKVPEGTMGGKAIKAEPPEPPAPALEIPIQLPFKKSAD